MKDLLSSSRLPSPLFVTLCCNSAMGCFESSGAFCKDWEIPGRNLLILLLLPELNLFLYVCVCVWVMSCQSRVSFSKEGPKALFLYNKTRINSMDSGVFFLALQWGRCITNHQQTDSVSSSILWTGLDSHSHLSSPVCRALGFGQVEVIKMLLFFFFLASFLPIEKSRYLDLLVGDPWRNEYDLRVSWEKCFSLKIEKGIIWTTVLTAETVPGLFVTWIFWRTGISTAPRPRPINDTGWYQQCEVSWWVGSGTVALCCLRNCLVKMACK